MGGSHSVPGRCALCNTETGTPVILKCKHQFCGPCIGDLWSTNPTGPYHCPEWRCKTVYQNLPFVYNLPPMFANKPQSATGPPSNDDSDSLLRRPSLTSRLLGKRKASTRLTEQPESKQSSVEAPWGRSADTDTPSTSSSGSFTDEPRQSTSVEISKEAVHPKSAQSECWDGTAASANSDTNVVPASDGPADFSHQENQRGSEEIISLAESDNSNEVDICDAPLLPTPERDAPVTEMNTSPSKPASPSNSAPFSGVSSHVEHVKNSAAASGSPNQVGIFFRSAIKNTSPLPCHYCPKTGCQSAVKTCLVCGASMCSEHLRPHLDSPVFQNHILVPPMEDISTWRCQEHQEINRIYCRDCGVCVCTVCTVIGLHRSHICISIRDAEREFRGKLKDEIKLLQEAETQVKNRVTELTQKRETFRGVLSEACAGVQQQYSAIREALEQEEQTVLQCVMKEEREVLGGLEEKLSNLQKSLLSIQQGLHTMEALADAKVDKRIQDQAFITEFSKTAKLTSNMGDCAEQFVALEELDEARLKCLQTWSKKRLERVVITVPGSDGDLYRLLYGFTPLLNRATAHPKLRLSDNNRRVTYSETQQPYTENEARFSSFPQVLAFCALEGGRWYWEVNVTLDEGRWKVGLCEEQIERKGQKDNSRLGFNSHSWCLACDGRKVEALHNKLPDAVEADGLRRVGVFLNYEDGVLSFFNVTPGGSLMLMHSYKHRFTSPVYPAFSASKTHLTICDLFQS